MIRKSTLLLADALRVLQVTDTHLYPDINGELQGVNTFQSFRTVMNHALEGAIPDLLIATGDLAQEPDRVTYNIFLEVVREVYQGPLVCTPGNHDLKVPFGEILPTQMMSLSGWYFVPLDSHVDNRVEGHVSQIQLENLQKVLVHNCPGPTIVFGHHPPVKVGAEWLDQHRMKDGDQLVNMMNSSGNVRGYICGHVHQAYESGIGGLRVLTTPSTCFQFEPASNRFAVAEGTPGYRWLELSPDGSIKTEVVHVPTGELALDLESRKR